MLSLLRERGAACCKALMLLFCLCMPLTVAAQKPDAGAGERGKSITYNCQGERLSVALQQVERLSGYYKLQFTYEDVEPHRVSVKLNAVGMVEAMRALLKNTGLDYEVNGRFVQVFLPRKANGKSVNIEGSVVDAQGNPLEGAAVFNRTESSGVTCDLDGRFELKPEGDVVTLTFSYLGKKSATRKAKRGETLRIVLEDDETMLTDVVVTGYQQIDRRHLTSAVSTVKMEDLMVPGMTNLAQMLEGKIPDMAVSTNSGELNATPRLRIRGTSTIIGNREPLWVVDGIIVNDPVNLSPDVLNDPDYVNRIGNAISGLNPQDIERLDVLKDAAATALYGTRAANGVIVVTTKKGRAGKPQVSYSMTGTLRLRPAYSDRRIDLMNSKERILFSKDLVQLHYIYPQDMPLVGYEYALSRLYKGEYSPEEFQAQVARMQTMNTDWFDLLTSNSVSHDHNANISGGSEKVRYYVSLGHSNESDVIKDSKNKRYTAVAKVDLTLSDRTQLSFNVNGYQSTRHYPQASINPIDYAYNASRAIPAYESDGKYAFYKKNTGTRSRFMNFNILNELDNSYQLQTVSGFTATANLRYQATDWLNIHAVLSGFSSAAGLEGHWGDKTFYVARLRDSEYGQAPPTHSSLLPYGGELSTQTTRNTGYTTRLQFNLQQRLGEKHLLAVSLGGEANSNRYEAQARTERGYFQDRGKKFISDISDEFTEYTKWLRSNVPTLTDTQTNLLSAYLTASYTYDDFLTLNANTRYDGANKFGSRSNEKMLPVWSVSGMVDLMRFISPSKRECPLDQLSFKASYGEQGNMLDGQTSELVIRKGTMSHYYNELTSSVVAFANPDLRWEKTRSMNLGLEGSLWKNRLMFGLEYYYKRTTDAFMNKPISDVNGYTSYVVNSGIIVNKGYNLSLTAIPVRHAGWFWSLSGTLSKSMNAMKTNPGMEVYELGSFLNGTAVVEGQPIGTFWSYRFKGLNPENGGPMIDDQSEQKDELRHLNKFDTYTRVLTPSGVREPSLTGSLSHTISYKNWRLNASFYYSLGAKTRLFRIFKNFVGGYSSELNMNRDLLRAWKKPGDELTTHIPAVMGKLSPGYDDYADHWSHRSSYTGAPLSANYWEMYDYSTARVVSADFLKLSHLSLTYELPARLLQPMQLSRLAITLGATNLFTLAHRDLKGQTPTQSGFNEVQLGDTPTYTMGLVLNF